MDHWDWFPEGLSQLRMRRPLQSNISLGHLVLAIPSLL